MKIPKKGKKLRKGLEIQKNTRIQLKSIENKYWLNESLSEKDKIRGIITELEQIKNGDSIIVIHALVKWNDKLQKRK